MAEEVHVLKNLSREGVNSLLIAVCLMVSRPACSQEVPAAIAGSVVDPTGASIVNADVVAKDIEKGTTYIAQTNDDGIFNIQLSVTKHESIGQTTN
jgi:hypothetical protein